ncbi:MAG TPA: adenosylcobinamide-GDP ribazoletransferase [Gaiellaceae bacterium]|nr:adenosylcobinamide-GDP ribazoletransferase [Gaiellaceae bacterium]
MRGVAAAISFLTRLPVARWVTLDAGDVARGIVFFPLVGAAVGAGTGLVALGTGEVLPALLAAVVAIAFEAVLTGAIHLDALGDLADATGGGTRERALEILRDPRIGAFGAVALVVDVLLRAGALAALVAEDGLVGLVVASFALGRAAPLAIGWALPYARPGAGSGRALTDEPRTWERVAGLVIAGAIAFGLVGLDGGALVGGAALGAVLVGLVAWRRLGGATGDVLGAGIEAGTAGALLAAVATS